MENLFNWGSDSQADRELRQRLEMEALYEQAIRVRQARQSNMAIAGGGSVQATSASFTCTVDTQANLEMYFSFTSTGEPINFTIDWGDGTIHVDEGLGGFYSESHTYSDPAVYTIKVTFDKPSQVLELNFPGFDDDYASLTSITGLQTLANLQEFRADYNSLVSVDFSGMTNLTYIDISDCEDLDTGAPSLTGVNVSGCTSLEYLYLDDSDFSAGIPDLTGLNNLAFIDLDDCNITSIDLSMLPSLRGFDLSNNDDITNVIISNTQPLGNGENVDVDDGSLTQSAVDAILVALSTNEVENGYVDLSGGTNSHPGSTGLDALEVLAEKNWNWNVNEAPPAPPSSVSIPASTDFDIVGNFTIEAFFIDNSVQDGTTFPRLYSFGTYPAANSISIEPGGVYFWANNEQALYSNFSPILDQWHHICIIGSGSTLYMLIDGVQVASSLYEGAIYSQGLPLTIGSGGEVNTGFNGLISNFRLSAAPVYDPAGFTVPTATLTNLEPTKLLILQGTDLASLLTDNSGNGHGGSISGNVSVSNNDPFGSAESSLQFGT